MDLLNAVGEGLLAEQFIEKHHLWTHLSITFRNGKSDEEKQKDFNSILRQFMTAYGNGCIDNPSEIDHANNAVRTVQN